MRTTLTLLILLAAATAQAQYGYHHDYDYGYDRWHDYGYDYGYQQAPVIIYYYEAPNYLDMAKAQRIYYDMAVQQYEYRQQRSLAVQAERQARRDRYRQNYINKRDAKPVNMRPAQIANKPSLQQRATPPPGLTASEYAKWRLNLAVNDPEAYITLP